jgi:predicted amidohydrolase
VRLTILELAARWAEASAVLDEVDARLAAGPPSDLVVLPEAALHGYVSPAGDFDLTRFAEPLDGPTATRCAAIAKARGVHLVAPLVLREGAAVYNAIACFDPAGAPVFVYRKRHPWFPEEWATPGPEAPPVVEIAGRRVTCAICFDVHFLADDAAAQLAAADLLMFPSAWVEEEDSRPQLLSALARQFELSVANANWAPGVVRIPGQGGSCVFGPRGQLIARAGEAGRIDVEL